MDMNKLLEAAKARKAAIDARKASGAGVAKIPNGTSRWRILPGWRPESPEVYYHDFGQHWIKDREGNVLAVYVCEWDTFQRPCDFCAPLKESIRATKDDAVLKALKEMTSRRTVLVNAVQISGVGFDATKANQAALLGLPIGVADTYANLFFQRLAEEINMLHLTDGRDIVIEKTGTGLNTRYTVTDAAKNTPAPAGVMDSIVNIDGWIEAQRQQGLAKGVTPLNSAIADALRLGTGGTVSRGASLVAATGASAAAEAWQERDGMDRFVAYLLDRAR